MVGKKDGRAGGSTLKCENGKAIFKGVAVGRIVFCESKERMVKRKRVQDTEHEIIRYLQAKK